MYTRTQQTHTNTYTRTLVLIDSRGKLVLTAYSDTEQRLPEIAGESGGANRTVMSQSDTRLEKDRFDMQMFRKILCFTGITTKVCISVSITFYFY